MAKSNKPAQGTDVPEAKVLKEFRDIDNFNTVWEVGDDVGHFAPERLAVLIDRGLVEKPAEPEPEKPAA